MKRFKIQLFSLMIILSSMVSGYAQDSNKETRSQLDFKPTREVRKTVKQYKKDGYYAAVGAPSLERQYTNMLIKQKEKDQNNQDRYLTENTKVVGESQVAAKLQAMEAGKLLLAGRISTDIVALIENNIANAQLSTAEASSVTQVIGASKNMIAQQIGMVTVLFEAYKDIQSNIEANLIIAINSEEVKQDAKKIVRKELEEKTNLLQDKIDRLLKF